MTMNAQRAVERANPVRSEEVRQIVDQAWSDATLSAIPLDLQPPAARQAGRSGSRFPALAVVVLALFAVPALAVAAVVRGLLEGEPAPSSVVENFESYTPQLGFRPESDHAVRVASDGRFTLFATSNDLGGYCVATSTQDGGICLDSSVAAAPLVAGIMPGDPTRADARGTTLVGGRVSDARAVVVTLTDPDGGTVSRPIGESGFFLAALQRTDTDSDAVPFPCKNGDWVATLRALDAAGSELVTAQVVLARAVALDPGTRGGCHVTNGPHG